MKELLHVPMLLIREKKRGGTLGTNCDLLETIALPEMQALLLAYIEPGKIGSNGQRFWMWYWNETDG